MKWTYDVYKDRLNETAPVKHDDDVYTMDDFERACQSGCFIDYDGFGVYSDGKVKWRFRTIVPSDFERGAVDRAYSHVVWYNR